MKVSEFKSNYCFRIQILNVIEHRVTERMSEDYEYPLLKTYSRANASPCTGELKGAEERVRERARMTTEIMKGATHIAITRAGGRCSTGLQLLAWPSPGPLATVEGPTSWREG